MTVGKIATHPANGRCHEGDEKGTLKDTKVRCFRDSGHAGPHRNGTKEWGITSKGKR